MEITEEKQNKVIVLYIAGEIDLYNSSYIKKKFISLRRKGEARFIFDFSGTTYMDSSGIGVLIYLYTSAKNRNLHIRFTGFRDNVFKVIELTRLVRILPITQNLDNAVLELKTKRISELKINQLVVNENHALFDKEDMYYKEFYIKYDQIRRLSLLIAQQAPEEIRELNILEQQISELIKNAVKHGNKCDSSKSVKIWFSFSSSHAHLIIEDQGEGFKALDKWNEFYRNKITYYYNHDYDKMMDYLSFRTLNSDETDGGNAMFAAVEYWNQGVVFNYKKNAVAVKRIF
jgi:anti-anti-sigma factor